MKNEDLYVYKKSDFYEDFISSQKEYYEREQVDTLLAEKDFEIDRLKEFNAFLKQRNSNGDVGCSTKRGFKNSIAVSEAFDKLEAENADLKQKLENVQASKFLRVPTLAGNRNQGLQTDVQRGVCQRVPLLQDEEGSRGIQRIGGQKMSELKAYMYDDMIDGDADTNIEYYPKSEADKVISDKDAEIAQLQAMLESRDKQVWVLKHRIAPKQSDKTLQELLNEVCKKHGVSTLQDLDWAFCESEKNRRLKRALWLSRALRARDKAFEYHFKNNVEMCAKWDNVHLMLMAKAEEYK